MEKDEATSMARATLKKVLASRGKVQGNFYFVADGSAKKAVVVVTLASKDKKGTRAVSQGRPFRKEFKGARYARGSVVFQDGKMVFTVHKGTANKKGMTDGLRKIIAKEKGLGFLKRAVVTNASASKEEAAADLLDGGDVDAKDLKAAEAGTSSEELDALAEAQGDLSELSSFFTASDEELEAVYAQDVSDALDKLKALQSQDTVDEDARSEAWAELASLCAVGRDNLPQLGEDLSPELTAVLQAASRLVSVGDRDESESRGALGKRLLQSLHDAERRYFAADEPEDVAKWLLQAERLHSEGAFEEGLAMVDKEIAWRLERAERSESVREEIEEATGGDRVGSGVVLETFDRAHAEAVRLMEAFQQAVTSDTEVKIDPRFSEIASR
ncbi:MAG: DNA-binding transcriptional regulator PaaX, partial [Myxococcota bacterium]